MTLKNEMKILYAAAALLGRLDTITVLQFAQGADRAERETLRALLQAAIGGDIDYVALAPETPAATYSQTPGTIGDMARILERAAQLPERQRMLFAHTLEALVEAAEGMALEAANNAGDS